MVQMEPRVRGSEAYLPVGCGDWFSPPGRVGLHSLRQHGGAASASPPRLEGCHGLGGWVDARSGGFLRLRQVGVSRT